MPIIIKDFVWNQTKKTVIVKVPLHNIHHSKIDVFYTKSYLKLSFEQYFFEVFLQNEIVPETSRCLFCANEAIFELCKSVPQDWDDLELNIPKQEKQALKKLYIEEEHQRVQRETENRRDQKCELKRVAVREQIKIDAKQREDIEDIKRIEKETSLKKIFAAKPLKVVKHTQTRKKPEVPVPPPRTSQVLEVSFTPREFPTPCRESRLEEEEDWLRKQAEARRSVGFQSEDLRPEEHSPQFLKFKGDNFLKAGNFLAAISAFSFGISLNKNFPELYAGRAEAHLAVGNYHKTVSDCTKALELMKPEVPQNVRERALCIGHRGIALNHLGLIKQGIGELKASLCLMPNEGFRQKLQEAVDALDEAT